MFGIRKEVTLLELSIFKKSTIVDVFQSFLNTLNHKTIKLYKENTNSKMSYLSVLNYKERANQLTGIYMKKISFLFSNARDAHLKFCITTSL